MAQAEAELIRVATIGQVQPGGGTVVTVGGRTLALFNVDGSYYAIDNTCPHRGGPLGEGDLEGCVVTCPWHAWGWDVTTGANTNNPAVKVRCYPVTVRGDGLFVHLSPGIS
jgi:nitrite reductase/ring-hydroxylating ferredoxin subunit